MTKKSDIFCFPLTRKVQILQINENLILLAGRQKVFSKKFYLSGMK